MTDRDGRIWRTAAFAGRPVLLNFWASWCAPCRAEMPSLGRLAVRHRKDGLVVLSVNYKETPAVIAHYLESTPIDLPILLDTDGDATSAWTPRVFPSTVLIDRAGRALSTVIGELDWAGTEAAMLLAPLLAPASTEPRRAAARLAVPASA